MNSKVSAELQNLVRQSAVSRLKLYSQREDIVVEEIENPPRVFAHWMSIILVAGRALRATFKAHYMTKEAKYYALKAYAKPIEELTEQQAADYMKEYCNLTAGNIKRLLEVNSVSAGISLPLVTRGFDEVFFPITPGQFIFRDHWRMVSEGHPLDCSVVIEVYDEAQLKDLKIDDQSEEDLGEVDFL